MTLIYTLLIGTLLIIGFTRCLIFNIHKVIFYTVYDIADYIYNKKWRNFNYYGIDMFIGMFGHGKTLCATHKARMIYKRFGNRVRFISNYKLLGIPYIPLINFQQIVQLEYDTSDYAGTVILIDEIEDVLSHRNYKDFPLSMLSVLTQQRKNHVYIMCTAQRFFMVDKIFRGITTHVIDCNKLWRFQHVRYFDAWEYENCLSNIQLLKPLTNKWWFVSNKDYRAYDTSEMISSTAAEDFISNDEKLVRMGLDASPAEYAIQKPSRALRKLRKKRTG